MTLEEAIAVQDALEAITEGCSREDYMNMHKPGMRAGAGFSYDAALIEIWSYGTVRKALNAVKRAIEVSR